MRLGTLLIQLQCFPTRCISPFEICVAPVPVHVKKRAAVRDSRVRATKVWINLDRAIEHAPCILQAGAAQLMKDLPPTKAILVGLYVFGWVFFKCARLVLPYHPPHGTLGVCVALAV